MITAAIGDIHGRTDLLDDAIEYMKSAGVEKVVFLGDYIDRGPDSRGVLERIINLATSSDMEVVALLGNHEKMMLNATGIVPDKEHPMRDHMSIWLRQGGAETAMSFGLNPQELSIMAGMGFSTGHLFPKKIIDFLLSLDICHQTDTHFFVHAGIDPSYPVSREDQYEEAMLWIRTKFLQSEKRFERYVVHGHTPCSTPEVLDNRTNLDTGAYKTGHLPIGIFGPNDIRPSLIHIIKERAFSDNKGPKL